MSFLTPVLSKSLFFVVDEMCMLNKRWNVFLLHSGIFVLFKRGKKSFFLSENQSTKICSRKRVILLFVNVIFFFEKNPRSRLLFCFHEDTFCLSLQFIEFAKIIIIDMWPERVKSKFNYRGISIDYCQCSLSCTLILQTHCWKITTPYL